LVDQDQRDWDGKNGSLSFMRRLHAPLEFDSVQNGYYYTDPSYRLGYVPTTEGELVALLVAAQVMDQYRGTPFEQDLRKALAKISEILPATIEVPLDALTGCLSVLPRVQTTYDPEIFRVLVTAVRQSRQLSMVYWTAGRNETQRRTFDPYDLVLAPDDDWCLIGHCHLRNDIRLFKVQRVRSAVETGECFCRPAGFKARDYMAESFGTIRGEGDFHVVLRFTRAYAGRIAEKQWHAGQVVEPQPDGSLILRLHVNDLHLIKRWVMYRAAECGGIRTGGVDRDGRVGPESRWPDLSTSANPLTSPCRRDPGPWDRTIASLLQR